MKNQLTFPKKVSAIGFVPAIFLAAAFLFLSGVHIDTAWWESHREFWGGNPSEVYSHWLDMVLLSGNALGIAWLVAAEAFLRRQITDSRSVHYLLRRCAVITFVMSGIVGVLLDISRGEGTVLFVFPILFLPILASSYYLLRKLAGFVRWNVRMVIALCLTFATANVAAQLYYEPSETGGPNGGIVPIGLGVVTFALIWAFVSGISSGRLQRFSGKVTRFIRKTQVWGTALVVLLAVGIPLTISAQRLHRTSEQLAIKWLDELETKLSDPTVADLKRNVRSMPDQEKLPVPDGAEKFLDDPRIESNSLRIYIPLREGDYMFLWANSRFKYHDTRKLRGDHSEEIDQRFIDTLMRRGGTHQTGLYSILWSPYLAGRVLKDNAGAVKAICVINVADD